MERRTVIETVSKRWQRFVLPLNQRRFELFYLEARFSCFYTLYILRRRRSIFENELQTHLSV